MKNGLVAVLLVLAMPAFADDRECYKDEEAFMVAAYGSAYRDDENFVVRKQRHGNQLYYVAGDVTPGTNVAWTLLMPTKGRGLCRVLTTYPVIGLKPVAFDRKGRPLVFEAEDQGTMYFHRIIYAWDRSASRYKPTKCMKVTWAANRERTTNIPCADDMN